jgi:hypothetical protein
MRIKLGLKINRENLTTYREGEQKSYEKAAWAHLDSTVHLNQSKHAQEL